MNNSLLPIIDTHQHLWDLDRFQLGWLDGAPEILRRSYDTADYREATRGLNVVKAVYMEVDVVPQQQQAEADYILQLCESPDHPTVAAVISGRPASSRFRDYIGQFRGNRFIKGVRQVLHTPDAPRRLCLQKRFIESMRLLGEMGMSFDLCMRPGELSDGAKLTELCPDTRFIIDHCGNADPKAFTGGRSEDLQPEHDADTWRRDMEALAGRPNTICKISGIVARAPRDWTAEHLAPVVDHCLDQFGPDRVVFGGDWPVCLLGASYREWVEALKEIISNRPLDEQRKLLHDNAERFYGLSSTERPASNVQHRTPK